MSSSGIKHFHAVVQPFLPSNSRTLASFPMETVLLKHEPSSSSQPLSGSHHSAFCLYEFIYSRASCKWNYAIFVVLCQASSRVIHFVMEHVYKAQYYSIVCVCYIMFIHSSIDGHLHCFPLLAIVDNLAMNMVCKYLFKSQLDFFGANTQSGIWVKYYLPKV